jgi:hypothetical protein
MMGDDEVPAFCPDCGEKVIGESDDPMAEHMTSHVKTQLANYDELSELLRLKKPLIDSAKVRLAKLEREDCDTRQCLREIEKEVVTDCLVLDILRTVSEWKYVDFPGHSSGKLRVVPTIIKRLGSIEHHIDVSNMSQSLRIRAYTDGTVDVSYYNLRMPEMINALNRLRLVELGKSIIEGKRAKVEEDLAKLQSMITEEEPA